MRVKKNMIKLGEMTMPETVYIGDGLFYLMAGLSIWKGAEIIIWIFNHVEVV